MTDGWKFDCRHFDGGLPCVHRRVCADCPHHDPVETRLLLVQLGALGDVLRTTSLLPAIRRAWPRAHLTWLTRPDAAPLLRWNPLVDRVLLADDTAAPVLDALRFDAVLNPDKSRAACALSMRPATALRRGFMLDAAGAIRPCDRLAERLFELGLDDRQKFFVNDKPAQQLLADALGLPYRRERYVLVLDDAERRLALELRREAGASPHEVLIGWNTGAGARWPYKRLEEAEQIRLVDAAAKALGSPVRHILLGGGADDARRNAAIADGLRERSVLVSEGDCASGLRHGIAAMAGCDMVVTGDTLGLHLAIALKKPVVAWFTVTCHQEIDFYGRGIAVLADVGCRPCMLTSCDREPKCFRSLPFDATAAAIVHMASGLLRDGAWAGQRTIGAPPAQRRG